MLAHVRAAPVVAALAVAPLGVLQERVSAGHSPGNGSAEGSGEELGVEITFEARGGVSFEASDWCKAAAIVTGT